jgi:ABC-type glycerol-3-phosphate transport system substrate-binding protein
MTTTARVSTLAAALGLMLALPAAFATTATAPTAATTTKKAAMTPPSAAKPAKKAAAKKLVLARTKHNGAGVVLRYGVPAVVAPGQPATVTLQLTNVTAPDGAQVRIEPEGTDFAVAERGGARLRETMALEPGAPHQMDLQVSAAADGMYFLNVFVTQSGRMSAYSVPVKVGKGTLKLKQEGTVHTLPSGEKIVSMPSTN